MPKKTGRIGGFTASNSGGIENCYSVVRLKAKGYTAGGFAGDNTGVIFKCCYCGRISKLTGGFTGEDKGNTEDSCYFFHNEKEGSKKIERLSDSIRGQRLGEIESGEDMANLGFDMEDIWQYTDGEGPLRFIPEKWLFDVTRSPKIDKYRRAGAEEMAPIVISKAEELWDLAKRINEGDRELADAYIKLEEDISLGGKEWIPIGRDRSNAFTGIFDGAGHCVSHFIIKDKKVENKGFFGFLKGGEVYNLSVDCNVKGGTCAGGIAAQNEGGTIGCCAAVIEIKGKNGLYGGLAGRNTGRIFESYAAGRIFFILIPWWWGILPMGLLLFFAIAIPKLPKISVFAPVPYDQDQIPIPDETVAPNTDGNFVSFQFEQEIDVDLSTGMCKFGFKNPGNSNHNIVVQLQFTDAQAVRVMGSWY